MSKEKARQNYLDRSGPRKLNCAEAVAYAFRDRVFFSESELQRYAAFGGGHAPGGYCGAVYAAQCLLQKTGSPRAGEIPALFSSIIGSSKCREIKALRKVSCLACVEKAAEIVENARI